MEEKKKIRLNKFLAERLGVSRREADLLIAGKAVTVDGKTAIIGDRVDKNSKVCYNGSIVPFENKRICILMNKPRGYVSSRKRQGETPTLYELLPKEYQKLKTVGRLDKDSCGLILLTNDGDLAFRMTHPSFKKEKKYTVKLDCDLEPLHQQMIADFGIELTDGKSKMQLLKLGEGRKKWQVTISEGRNRQIRRTFGALGYTVVFLERTQFGQYVLDGLEAGKFVKIA